MIKVNNIITNSKYLAHRRIKKNFKKVLLGAVKNYTIQLQNKEEHKALFQRPLFLEDKSLQNCIMRIIRGICMHFEGLFIDFTEVLD